MCTFENTILSNFMSHSQGWLLARILVNAHIIFPWEYVIATEVDICCATVSSVLKPSILEGNVLRHDVYREEE